MSAYDSSAIEVLTGLEPVRRRPGMYTQTERPNHLAQEVVDNSVDEAIAGHAKRIDVVLHADNSLSVSDDGRGMPVDKHKGEKVSGVEVILTRLHAGGKFSNKNYTYSGGLHGVGVSVVNALSKKLEVRVKRDGKEYRMTFADGAKTSELRAVGNVGKRETGTTVRFWPDPKFFDTVKFSTPKLKHLLRAKAVLLAGLHVTFTNEQDPKENEEWQYEAGLRDYLVNALSGFELLPAEPFLGQFKGTNEEVDWAIVWLPQDGEPLLESYVNLIPTPQDGTHVNGFRTGLTEALREFCEFRNLLPRGVKLAPEDVWGRASYVLSFKTRDPQFSGQTKERLTSRDAAAFVAGVTKDSFGIWLAQHVNDAETIAKLAIESAQLRLKAEKKIERKKIGAGPAL
ncbi:MAG: ATP-binding protein, partial [Gammaproteobacteria bacterium]